MSFDPRISQIVNYWAKKTPNHIAILQGDTHWTYLEFEQKVQEVVEILISLGVHEGNSVLIALPNSYEFAAIFFACIELKLIPVTVSPDIKPNELDKLVTGYAIHLLVTTSLEGLNQNFEFLRNLKMVVIVNIFRVRSIGVEESKVGVFASRFSSGSTGLPKRINYTEDNLNEDFWHLARDFGLTAEDSFLGATPFYHAFGGLNFLASLGVGGKLVVVDKFWPSKIISSIEKYQITTFLCTPSMIELLNQSFIPDIQSKRFYIRNCVCATGKISVDSVHAFYEKFRIKANILYGSTESLSACFCLFDNIKDQAIGKPFSRSDIRIFDGDNQISDPFVVGLVGIKGDACVSQSINPFVAQNSLGYTFPGDKGYFDESGYFFIIGRDDQINIGGFKVDAHEIEAFVRRYFSVSFVKALSYQRQGQASLGLLVESDADSGLLHAEIIADCKKHFIDYKVPSLVVIKDQIPRDSNGKVSQQTALEIFKNVVGLH